MENISIKKHLIIALVIAILLLVFSVKFKQKGKLLIKLFLSIYILIITYVILYDIYLQYNLNRFDIDNNGFFSGSEITSDQKKAMQ